MLAGARPSDTQIAYANTATQAAVALRDRLSYVRKWGAEDDFLGDGMLCRLQAGAA